MNFSSNVLQIKKGFSLPIFGGVIISTIITLIFLVKKGASPKDYFRALWIQGTLILVLLVLVFLGDIFDPIFSGAEEVTK